MTKNKKHSVNWNGDFDIKNMKKDVKPVEEVLRLVKSLRDTWVKAVEISQKEAASSLIDEDEDEDEDEEDDEGYEG